MHINSSTGITLIPAQTIYAAQSEPVSTEKSELSGFVGKVRVLGKQV